VLATASAALSDPSGGSHPTDSANLTSDTLPDATRVADTTEPVLATTSTALSDPSGGSHPTDSANLASDTLPDATPVADTTEPVLSSTALTDPSSGVSHPTNSGGLASDTPAGEPDSSTDQAAGPAETLLALATADAPIEVPESATAPANVTAAAEPIAFEGDVIALNGAEQQPDNALFTGTQYTDYGVTLSSNIEIPQQATVSSADTGSTHDAVVPVAVGDVQQPAPAPDVVDTATPIDHLGLRDAVL
jgi:hypothetical protein